MLPGQPVDCASPLANHATRKIDPEADEPKAKHATADASMPKPMSRRAPARSPNHPLRYCPSAYAARYTVSTP